MGINIKGRQCGRISAGMRRFIFSGVEEIFMAGTATDYFAEISNLEGKSKFVLDRLIDTLERGDEARKAVSKVKEIEGKAAEMHFLEGSDELELNERTVRLDRLDEELAFAAGKLPDAVIAASQDEIVQAMEEAISNLHSARRELKRAQNEETGAAHRKLKAKAVSRIEGARETIGLVDELLEKKPRVPDHPVEKAHARAKLAISKARSGIARKGEQIKRQRLSLHATKLREEMKMSLQKQLEGRIFVDSKHVQVRSWITGQVHEWKMDDAARYALEDLIGESTLASILPKVMRGEAHLAAKFTCKPSGDGLQVELDAGERTIVGGAIVFKPHKARVGP